MPCSDGGPSREQIEDQKNVPAMLCALLVTLERTRYVAGLLDGIDWDEAGITREWFDRWWTEHKRIDRQRRSMLGEEQRRAELRTGALAKLSLAEMKALGVGP